MSPEQPRLQAPSRLLLGAGFATDAFDLFSMSAMLTIIATNIPISTTNKQFMTSSAVLAAAVGQILFGAAGDLFSKRTLFITSASLMCIGSIFSAVLPLDMPNFFVWECVARSLLGLGIGGEYPLSAALGHNLPQGGIQTSAQRLSTIFMFQGVGTVIAALLSYVATLIVPTSLAWRACPMFGAIVSILLAIWRYRRLQYVDEICASYTIDDDHPTLTQNLRTLLRGYPRQLFGSVMNWFLLDIVFYGNGLFASQILSKLVGQDLDVTLSWNLVLALLAMIGYPVSVFLCERLGRRNLQWGGFLLMSITYLSVGLLIDEVTRHVGYFVLLYGLTFLWTNAGPNTTTYVTASELFPPKIRATACGISAAAGKLGAFTGTMTMVKLADSASLATVFFLCAGISILGVICSLICTDDMRIKKDDRLITDDNCEV